MRFDWTSFFAGIVAGLLLAYIALCFLWWWAHWRVRRQYGVKITSMPASPPDSTMSDRDVE